jgi:3-dehydroquinate synthase
MIYQTIPLQFASCRYNIYLGENLYTDPSVLQAHIIGRQVMIVTQEKIASWYLEKLQQALCHYQCEVVFLPEGEPYKNIEQWQKILTALLHAGHDRSTTLIALGGGMVGDMTGFAAACYQRGVNYLQIPTTLIAQVDAAMGGKTAVNHPLGKNVIGAIHQPQCVIVDIQFLNTLSQREYTAGVAEIIKYSLIQDVEFFVWLEKNMAALLARNKTQVLYAIYQCMKIKAQFVMQDEHDISVRQLLNFGHTFGHALETAKSYQELLHGEAVAIGMVLATQLSVKLGLLSIVEAMRIYQLLGAAGLFLQTDFPSAADFIKLMHRDKKTHAGKLHFILLKAIGQAIKTTEVTEQQIRDLLEESKSF